MIEIVLLGLWFGSLSGGVSIGKVILNDRESIG